MCELALSLLKPQYSRLDKRLGLGAGMLENVRWPPIHRTATLLALLASVGDALSKHRVNCSFWLCWQLKNGCLLTLD